MLLMWLMGALAVVSIVLWSVGAVAARVFGGAWPAAGAGDMPGVVGRLQGHLTDPGTAWPPADRSLMPGPLGFYATTVVLGAILTAIVAGGIRMTRPKLTRGDGARWASPGCSIFRVGPRAWGTQLHLELDGSVLEAILRDSSEIDQLVDAGVDPAWFASTAAGVLAAQSRAAAPVLARFAELVVAHAQESDAGRSSA